MDCARTLFVAIDAGMIATITPCRPSFPRKRLWRLPKAVRSIADYAPSTSNILASRFSKSQTIATCPAHCAMPIVDRDSNTSQSPAGNLQRAAFLARGIGASHYNSRLHPINVRPIRGVVLRRRFFPVPVRASELPCAFAGFPARGRACSASPSHRF